ncbi:MAG: hypothetical protein RL757_2913 [Bacteroidota bacterium]|jgi:geranylgeranyl diphosphate synthase type II
MKSLDQFAQIFQEYLSENLFHEKPSELYEPANYILNLGGKRLRPLLTLMGCACFSEKKAKMNAALPAAMAVEVFHNFTLVHDDIMDAAPLRRGKPTVHHHYGLNTGILSGDVMMILAYDFLSKTKPEKLHSSLLRSFNRMAIEVCEGQQMDMNFENCDNVSLDEYLKMIELKTAVLLACALEMGARIGGATPADAKHLAEFGRHTGIAFQIQDDILDTFGDPEKFGKKVGGDIIQNKKTFLVLKSLEIAPPPVSDELKSLLRSKTASETEENAKIERVRQIFRQLDTPKIAENAMQAHLDEAFAHLDAAQISEENRTYMKSFAQWLITRAH